MHSTSALAGKKVLITGAGGFVGSHLVERLLTLGASVIALDSRTNPYWDNARHRYDTLTVANVDLTDRSALQRIFAEHVPDIVFHLAGNANVPNSVKHPTADFASNCTSTVEVLEAMRLFASRARLVLASTSAVYGEPGREKIKETTPLQPIAPYGSSKVCAEEMCRIYYKTYNIHVSIGRLFNCYGPRMKKFVISDFITKLMSNPEQLEILGDGRQTRDFTYIDDAVSGLITIARNGLPGESYNISTGVSYSVTELAQVVIEALGLTGRTTISYSGSSWKGDAQFWSVDITKAQSIGYVPQFNLKLGVAKTTQWLQSLPLHRAIERAGETAKQQPGNSATLTGKIKNIVEWCMRSTQ
jgi:UDP-glucose 4-epimerase